MFVLQKFCSCKKRTNMRYVHVLFVLQCPVSRNLLPLMKSNDVAFQINHHHPPRPFPPTSSQLWLELLKSMELSSGTWTLSTSPKFPDISWRSRWPGCARGNLQRSSCSRHSQSRLVPYPWCQASSETVNKQGIIRKKYLHLSPREICRVLPPSRPTSLFDLPHQLLVKSI